MIVQAAGYNGTSVYGISAIIFKRPFNQKVANYLIVRSFENESISKIWEADSYLSKPI